MSIKFFLLRKKLEIFGIVIVTLWVTFIILPIGWVTFVHKYYSDYTRYKGPYYKLESTSDFRIKKYDLCKK